MSYFGAAMRALSIVGPMLMLPLAIACAQPRPSSEARTDTATRPPVASTTATPGEVRKYIHEDGGFVMQHGDTVTLTRKSPADSTRLDTVVILLQGTGVERLRPLPRVPLAPIYAERIRQLLYFSQQGERMKRGLAPQPDSARLPPRR